jgi:hypothetical protein
MLSSNSNMENSILRFNMFKRDYEKYEGVPRISVYAMKVFFALMFLLIGTQSWIHILTYKGSWDPTKAVAWCTWTAYCTLSFFGIYNTLKMLPIMLFMIFYKTLWLFLIAYPLWLAGQLKGSAAEEMTYTFIWVIIPILFFPWRYFFRTYILVKPKV